MLPRASTECALPCCSLSPTRALLGRTERLRQRSFGREALNRLNQLYQPVKMHIQPRHASVETAVVLWFSVGCSHLEAPSSPIPSTARPFSTRLIHHLAVSLQYGIAARFHCQERRPHQWPHPRRRLCSPCAQGQPAGRTAFTPAHGLYSEARFYRRWGHEHLACGQSAAQAMRVAATHSSAAQLHRYCESDRKTRILRSLRRMV